MHTKNRSGIKYKGQVLVVLTNKTTKQRRIIRINNIVTTAGDTYYAQRAVNTLPTNFTNGSSVFDGIMELYNGASAAPAKSNNRSNLAGLVTGSNKAMDSTYPKLNDDDPLNLDAGPGVITYRVSYSESEANTAGIADVIITNPTPGASEPLLMHAELTPFTKTSSDTLKIFINHIPVGV